MFFKTWSWNTVPKEGWCYVLKEKKGGTGCESNSEQSWMEYTKLNRLLYCRILQLLNISEVWIFKKTGMQCAAWLAGAACGGGGLVFHRAWLGKDAPIRASLLTGSHRSCICMSYRFTHGFEFALAPTLGRIISWTSLRCSCVLL